ncbi:MAG: hypothetical protein IKV62_09815 [Bacteroidales bacterium]|nr:hypothetical protein [Bacteroidales bacterium]
MDTIDTFLEKPYVIIDILPKQVPAGAPGRYFTVEKYFIDRIDTICRKFAEVLIRLNCYQDLLVSTDGEAWNEEFTHEDLIRFFEESARSHSPLFFLIRPADALINFSGDDHYMTLYSPDAKLVDLIRSLAGAEGLFVWNPEEQEC